MITPEQSPTALRRLSRVVALLTLFLIFAGAMVTSTGSGLSVPDWPLSYGRVMPPMVGGIFYEHGHRMIATLVGFLTLVQAIALQRREPKPFLRKLGWTALAVVILQGVFGGLTVLLRLPKVVSIAHAGLAEIFLCLNVAIAFFASEAYGRMRRDAAVRPSLVPAVTVAAVYLQIVLGALVRHRGAGLSIPDFPLSYGRLVPPHALLADPGVAVAFAHRIGALLVCLFIVAGALSAFRSGVAPLRRMYGVLLATVALQITLGGFTIWSLRNPVITSLHVVTGALLLALSLLTALVAATTSQRGVTSDVLLGGKERTA